MSLLTEKTAGKKILSLNDRFVNRAFFLILILGLVLRFYFYLANRDLGADEAHLALNFIHLGYAGLTQPLENFQSAPIFFLWSVETVSRIAGYGEMALRFVPFFISVLTFPFFFFFVRDLTKNKIVALLAFLLFALNWSVLYFATELKPYTIDISAFILIGFLIFSDWNFVARNRMLLLAICGSILLLFSISIVIILFCAGIYMIGHLFRLRRNSESVSASMYLIKTSYVWSVWGAVFFTNYFLFIYQHPYSAGMKSIWSWAFCSVNVSDFSSFIAARIEDTLFTNLLFFSKEHFFPYLLLLFFVISITNIVFNKKYNMFLFTLFPVLVHLLLSMVQVYPFFHRFILYLLPPVIILFTYGVFIVIEFVQRIHWSFALIIVGIFVFGTNITSFRKYADLRNEREIKPILKYIDQNYPNTPVLVVTPYTLYSYYYETGRVKNKNFKAIDWELNSGEFKNHRLVVPLSKNYLLFYSVGNDYDGYGEILREQKLQGHLVRQFDYSIFGISELKPAPFAGQGQLIQSIDFQSFKDIQPSLQGSKSYIPLWNNTSISYTIPLTKGKYALLLTGRGDAVKGIFPHLKITINQKILGDLYLSREHEKYKFVFDVDSPTNAQISIGMDNDEILNDEDRNAFIENIFLFEYGQ